METKGKEIKSDKTSFASLEFVYYLLCFLERSQKLFHFLLFSFVLRKKDWEGKI